jgi:hypothetical protein
MKYLRTAIASALGAAALVEFFFFGGGSAHVGLTLMFLLLLGGFFLALGLPKRGEKNFIFQVFLMAGVIGVALSFTLFDTPGLIFINFLSLGIMMGILFLQRSCGELCEFGQKGFLPELAVGYVLRPFLSITDPLTELKEISSDMDKADEGDPGYEIKKRVGKNVWQIVLALAVGIPLIAFLTLLLAQSDAVFKSFVENIVVVINPNLLLEIGGRIFLFLLIIPFASSIVWSYRNKRLYYKKDAGIIQEKTTRFPELSVIIILGLVNTLYLIYAGIQSVYLFGAWAGQLPGQLTYAEYARSGFFELAFIAVLNAGMILLTIRFTSRIGAAGKAIRILSVLLLALSGIQLASALRRMFLYIEAYGLSESRYLVTAFMILMAILFTFLLIKEWADTFPLLKVSTIACILALIIVNYSVPGFWIARSNVDRFLEGELPMLDVAYLASSADSILVVLENEDEILSIADEDTLGEMEEFHSIVDSKYFAEIEDEFWDGSSGYKKELSDNWKLFNVSKLRVLIDAE